MPRKYEIDDLIEQLRRITFSPTLEMQQEIADHYGIPKKYVWSLLSGRWGSSRGYLWQPKRIGRPFRSCDDLREQVIRDYRNKLLTHEEVLDILDIGANHFGVVYREWYTRRNLPKVRDPDSVGGYEEPQWHRKAEDNE